MSGSLENKKIDFYIYLWEMYSRSQTIEEFEGKVYKFFADIDSIEDTGALYIPVLKDFFMAQNIKLTANETELFSNRKILDYTDNFFIYFLLKKMSLLDKITENVEGKDDIKNVKEDKVKEFFTLFENTELRKKDIIEIIKHAIRKYLELSGKDAVFLINNKVIVRYFTEESPGVASRYGGIPEREMEKIYKERSEDYYVQIVEDATSKLLIGDLNFRKIHNIYFHQNYIKIIQKALAEQLVKDFLQNPSLLPSFTNYVFRIFFDSILMKLVDGIIELVVEGDSNIKNFISFYDGKELYLDEDVITKPTIIAQEETWSYVSISSVVKDREKARIVFEKENVEVERVSFLIDKMIESKEKLEKELAELDAMPNTPTESLEYKNIVLDIDIASKEIARRGEKLEELKEIVYPYKKELDIYEEKLLEIKKGIVATISNFRI